MGAAIYTKIAAFPVLARAYYEYMFQAEDFIALKALPPVMVSQKAGKYRVVDAARMLINEDIKRAPGSNYVRPNVDLDEAEWACESVGVEFPVPHETRAELSTQLQVDLLATRALAGMMLKKMEADAAALLFNTSTWTATSASAAWSTASTDIIGDVLTAKEKVRKQTGLPANTLIISAATLPSLLKNTGIRQSVFYNSVPNVPGLLGVLPSLLGLDQILVGGGVTNSAKEGATMTVADIWDSGYAQVCRVPKTGDLAEPAVGRSFIWTGSDVARGSIRTYEEGQTNSTIYQANDAYDQTVTQALMGELIDITP